MSETDFLAFEAAMPYLCDGGVFGTFIDWRGRPVIHAAADRLGLDPLNLIVWGTANAGMGSPWRSNLSTHPGAS